MKTFTSIALNIALVSLALAQQPATQDPAAAQKADDQKRAQYLNQLADAQRKAILRGEDTGVEVRLKDMARFRGVRTNQLTGFGLIIGLEGSGDTKKTPMTANVVSNLMKDYGIAVAPTSIDAKNVAVVMITAELPPFAAPGSTVDVKVSSIGDAKSLQGGVLLQAPLYAAGNHDQAYVVAAGSVSIGGFNVGTGGSTVQRNHVTVGRIPDGGIIESSVPTKLVFDGHMYIQLNEEDITTAHRVAVKINDTYPNYQAVAIDGTTIQITVNEAMNPVAVMSQMESIKVKTDIEAKIVINERTGTIVVGGNVKLGPAMIAHGALNIRIDAEPVISQPAPLSNGQTVVTSVSKTDASQETSKIAMLPPSTTVADLAKLLHVLDLKPTDIISIFQALKEQGALKGKLILQ